LALGKAMGEPTPPQTHLLDRYPPNPPVFPGKKIHNRTRRRPGPDSGPSFARPGVHGGGKNCPSFFLERHQGFLPAFFAGTISFPAAS
jgi:hypothetical protein